MNKLVKGPNAEMADRLRRTREAFGLNQASWCRLTGISPQAWNNYETGLRRISIDEALQLCQSVGITTDWIYRGIMSSGLPMHVQTALQGERPPKRPKH